MVTSIVAVIGALTDNVTLSVAVHPKESVTVTVYVVVVVKVAIGFGISVSSRPEAGLQL